MLTDIDKNLFSKKLLSIETCLINDFVLIFSDSNLIININITQLIYKKKNKIET